MVNRRQQTKEDINNSRETEDIRISTIGEKWERENKILLAIYEQTNIADLPAKIRETILKDIDFEKTPEKILIEKVQKKIEAIMSKK